MRTLPLPGLHNVILKSVRDLGLLQMSMALFLGLCLLVPVRALQLLLCQMV
jgi:hypothetical protein